MSDTTKPQVLLGVTGSIAAYKAVELARALLKGGAEVQVAMTRGGVQFVAPLTFEAITGKPVLTEIFDLSVNRIEHVEQAHAQDLILIAPATANTLARLACGLADDLLLATALASKAPIVVAPAMESGMWENQATQDNMQKLQERGVEVLGPDAGDLASGRTGVGRMMDPVEISARVLSRLQTSQDLAEQSVVITAGPTWEPIDPVRLMTNRSTGAMGIAIADQAAARGAQVTLVLGPTHLGAGPNVKTVRVETAKEMLAAAEEAARTATIFIAAAAVSDFRPADPKERKLKRIDPSANRLTLTENPDVLATVAQQIGDRAVVVGFAAETENVEERARGKMKKKGCHLVIGNQVGKALGFGEKDSSVLAVFPSRASEKFGPAPKSAVAQFVLDQAMWVSKKRESP